MGARRVMAVALAGVVAVTAAGCREILSRQYEYEEEVYLALDGSATIYVNASVPALVALRGLDLPLDPRARLDRRHVASFYDTPATRVARVTHSRRDHRRYVHIRLEVDDVRRLAEAAPFAWARYALEERDGLFVYRQEIDASAGREVGDVGWRGRELVAVRLHLPSRVPFHNQPSGTIDRGNIIAWEQPLRARLEGEPLRIEVHMETRSILRHTLTLFATIVALVGVTFAAFIWFVMRRAPALPGAPAPSSGAAPPGPVSSSR
jgi:hypothetical protein